MTVKLSDLSTLLLFALIGAVMWLMRQGGVTVVTVPEWALQPVEQEEDLSAWNRWSESDEP